jgi:hypothetical protein
VRGRPSVDVLVLALDLQPMQAAIVRAVLKGKGRPVPTALILLEMYGDADQSPARMYASFKESLSKMRKRLLTVGLSIQSAGYGAGYRAVWECEK